MARDSHGSYGSQADFVIKLLINRGVTKVNTPHIIGRHFISKTCMHLRSGPSPHISVGYLNSGSLSLIQGEYKMNKVMKSTRQGGRRADRCVFSERYGSFWAACAFESLHFMVPAFINWESLLWDEKERVGHAGKIGQFLDMMTRSPASRLFIRSRRDTDRRKQSWVVDTGLLMCEGTLTYLYEQEMRKKSN